MFQLGTNFIILRIKTRLKTCQITPKNNASTSKYLLFLVTFVSASWKLLGSVKPLLGKHISDGWDIKAKTLLDNLFLLSRTRESKIWCLWGFLYSASYFVFGHIIRIQEPKRLHFTWLLYMQLACFQATFGWNSCSSSGVALSTLLHVLRRTNSTRGLY